MGARKARLGYSRQSALVAVLPIVTRRRRSGPTARPAETLCTATRTEPCTGNHLKDMRGSASPKGEARREGAAKAERSECRGGRITGGGGRGGVAINHTRSASRQEPTLHPRQRPRPGVPTSASDADAGAGAGLCSLDDPSRDHPTSEPSSASRGRALSGNLAARRWRTAWRGDCHLLFASGWRALALASRRRRRDLALPCGRTAGAVDLHRGTGGSTSRARSGPRCRAVTADHRGAAGVASGTLTRRLDTGGVHGVAGVSVRTLRACAVWLDPVTTALPHSL